MKVYVHLTAISLEAGIRCEEGGASQAEGTAWAKTWYRKETCECEELGEVKQNHTVLGRVCCSPWSRKGLDTTWPLNSNNSTK